MYLYGEPGFFENWVYGIVIAFLFILGLFVLKFFFESVIGKKADRAYGKVMNKYEKLPYNTRKLVGVFSMIMYCLVVIALFIWVES
jgi:steroid 5-alpha reductase family enzyme